jgi:CRISPR-associated protein Csb1
VTDLKTFDHYLNDEGPVALVIRESLMPVEGPDGVVFPATFASGDGFEGGYNIDTDASGRSVALIDTVGSQANRIEPIFMSEKFRHLVPQIVVTAGDRQVSILEAGHRAGDALVRCSSLQGELQECFKAVLKGDAAPLASIAPTSLVFGVWDSRDTQAKLPRIVASTIRAYNVRKLRRSAQFTPATEYVNEQLLDQPADKKISDAYAERGFIHVPAAGTHGGVIADGGIRRDATLGLAALRLLKAGKDEARSIALRRYILGLSLVAFTQPSSSYLRQGCTLVRNPAKANEDEFVEVHTDGRREPCKVTREIALAYATKTAEAFGIGASRTVPFEKERALKDVSGEGDAKRAKKAAGKKAATKKPASEESDA